MNRRTHPLEVAAAWLLALVWLAPLATTPPPAQR